jgi:hypothetical protein
MHTLVFSLWCIYEQTVLRRAQNFGIPRKSQKRFNTWSRHAKTISIVGSNLDFVMPRKYWQKFKTVHKHSKAAVTGFKTSCKHDVGFKAGSCHAKRYSLWIGLHTPL